jgi:hypothetical protein
MRPTVAPLAFDPYSYVALTHDVEAAGGLYPTDTASVIVHSHDDGIGSEVECTTLRFAVLALTAHDLKAA